MNCLEIDHRGACVLVGDLRIPLTVGGLLSPFHPLDLKRWLPCSDGITIYRLELPHYKQPPDWTRDDVVRVQAAAHDALMRDNTELLERAKSAERAVANLRAKLAALQGTTDPVDPPNAADAPTEIPKSDHESLQGYSWAQYQTISAMGERAKELEAECLGLRGDVKIGNYIHEYS